MTADIRMRCAIHSASSGSIMVIPRERRLVRLYIQLADIRPAAGERFDKSNLSPSIIFQAAQKILDPYNISYDYCEWWTIYQIGQRVASGYHRHNRVFLAGDAVHTHSPKAGQGMNVSMHDTYNLGWKIGSVLNKTAKRSVLMTYESERRGIAKQLIDFDSKFSKMFSGRPAKDLADEAGISMKEFKEAFQTGNAFTSGLSTKYAKSCVVAGESGHGLTTLQVGMRFPSFQVVCQCDATPVQLGDSLKSNGLWRLIVFAGDITQTDTMNRLNTLGERLAAPGTHLSNAAVVEPILVHASQRQAVELLDMPKPFYQRRSSNTSSNREENEKRREDEFDYYRIFADDTSYHHGHGHAYEKYDAEVGAGLLVLVRPDQYISWIGEVGDVGGLETFLDGVLR